MERRDVARRLALVKKYTDLARHYAKLIKRLQKPPHGQAALLTLVGAWTMRGFDAAVALIRDDKLILANANWWKLEPSRGHFVVEGEEERRFDDLLELVRTRIPGDGERVRQSLRLRSARSRGRVLDLHVESQEEKGVRTTLILVFDVSAQMDTEQEVIRLREASQHRDRLSAVGEVAAGVAHDLESTLQGVLLRVGLIERDAAIDDKQRQNLGHLRFGLESAIAMIVKIRRLGSRQGEAPEIIDLKALIEEAIELVGLQFARHPGEKSITIERSIWPLPPVRVRKSEIFHLLVNLLINARDAMPRGGTVRISARTTDFGARVTVSDEGTGIAEELLARVFDPFFTTKGERGTGLGLSLALATMNQLGGRIRADNRPSGGAMITLDFPRLPSGRPRAKPSASSRGSRRRR